MKVFVNGKVVRIEASKSIGKGGEADIYKISKSTALKLYKQPNHADFLTPEQRNTAKKRIKEHQKKLKAFPTDLPPEVISPISLVTDQSGKKIQGYTMELIDGADVLLRYGDRYFRQTIDNNDVIKLFARIHGVVEKIHSAGVVIGDFNDLNVLVLDGKPYFIDADSFQYSSFLCKVFTERFVDPMLCDQNATRPMLIQPHNIESDWYAFEVMLMQSLLYVDPYGGVYKPKDKSKKVPHPTRPLKRITVFEADVKYPKPAVPYDVLSDDLLHHFSLVFQKDERGAFPRSILADLRWTKCTDCGTVHARRTCPSCKKAAPAAIREVVTYRGKVTSTRTFQTTGIIVCSDYQGGKIRFLYHKDGEFYREDDRAVSKGKLDGKTKFRIKGDATFFGRSGKPVVEIPTSGEMKIFAVDQFGTLPVFDANRNKTFWVYDGVLYRSGVFGQERIGDVLSGQTLFWVGNTFGFGFYRAGELSTCFVFDVDGMLNDTVNDANKIPYRLQGQLIDSTCFFAKDRCWFFYSAKQGSRTFNRCAVINKRGGIIGLAEAEKDDGSWLSQIRGKCAVGDILFAATDDGIVRVEAGGAVEQTMDFPDTEPFVDSSCQLFAGDNGIYIVDNHEIRLVQIG